MVSVLTSDIKGAAPRPPEGVPAAARPPVKPGADRAALWSLALGLLSIPLGLLLLGGIAGVVAIVLGIGSLRGNTLHGLAQQPGEGWRTVAGSGFSAGLFCGTGSVRPHSSVRPIPGRLGQDWATRGQAHARHLRMGGRGGELRDDDPSGRQRCDFDPVAFQAHTIPATTTRRKMANPIQNTSREG
jgi:hypothetical protein